MNFFLPLLVLISTTSFASINPCDVDTSREYRFDGLSSVDSQYSCISENSNIKACITIGLSLIKKNLKVVELLAYNEDSSRYAPERMFAVYSKSDQTLIIENNHETKVKKIRRGGTSFSGYLVPSYNQEFSLNKDNKTLKFSIDTFSLIKIGDQVNYLNCEKLPHRDISYPSSSFKYNSDSL